MSTNSVCVANPILGNVRQTIMLRGFADDRWVFAIQCLTWA